MKIGKIILFFLLGWSLQGVHAQHMDIEAMMKDTKLKVHGGVNANGLFYQSNQEESREPFTYLINGSLNMSFMTFSMPISYNITNQGDALNYKAPFDFNRFSIAPKYKWIQAYIGDNAMTFSPYTLSGHPFRGLGVELTPEGPYSISLMGGRLLKAVEGNDSIGLPAVYQRWGYGTKLGYEQEKYEVEVIGFYAKDQKNSLDYATDVSPKSNKVGSVKVGTTIVTNLKVEAEYALSVITDHTPYLAYNTGEPIQQYDQSSTHTKAFNAKLNYLLGKSSLGLVYENVDPNYQTFGAMYFNNDLENIGITFARPFWQDKLAISTQLGYQRDNLDDAKNQTNVRLVGNINAALRATEALNISGNYSNFSTTTNRRLNQFEYINNPNLNPADTLNYRQLSQNGNVNVNYVFGRAKNQNVNFNYAIAGQANKQGGIIRKGQASTVQNFNLMHSINFPSTQIGLNTSANYTDTRVGSITTSAYGGSLSASKKFFENKLNSNLGVLYNQSEGTTMNRVFGIKWSCSYVWLEQHNFSLYGIQMFKTATNVDAMNDLTLNFNYSYSF